MWSVCYSVAAQQRLRLGVGERRRIVVIAVAAVVVPVAVGRAAPHAAPARAAALRLHLPQLACRPATQTWRRTRLCYKRDKDTAPNPHGRDVTNERDIDIPNLTTLLFESYSTEWWRFERVLLLPTIMTL